MDPIVLGITGASALQLGERSLFHLLKKGKFVHLVLSKGSYKVSQSENIFQIPTDCHKQEEYWKRKFNLNSAGLKCHRWDDTSSCIASGSYRTMGMVIIPCTMGKIGRIASGIASDLIERAADVHLKERRELILSPRETPLSLIHLNNLITLAQAGAKIVPPIPAWYTDPKNLDEMMDFIINRTFESLVPDLTPSQRWAGPKK